MSKSKDKLFQWSNKLLDMSRRNRLLNFKETKSSTLSFMAPRSNELFRQLTGGVKLKIFLRGDKDEKAELDADLDKITISELKKGQLLTTKNDFDTKRILYKLRNRAKSAIEEQGINILYTAFGFLEWTDVNKEQYSSPLLLIPSKIIRESIISPYIISEFEDEILLNQTLAYKMKQTFNQDLPEYDEDKYEALDQYLADIRAIAEPKGWTVTEQAVMGFFSFNKLNMYMDLVNNQDKILINPIIKSICGETGKIEGFDEIDFQGELDSKLSAEKSFCVVDADSSQLDAVLQLRKGKSFVLQGPPGTGKSQTITNLIAECLANKKKVLFVSEKLAALNVVFRNLDRVGLEDFCLELHSHKANKNEVISELHETLTTERSKVVDKVYDELDTLSENINDLNDYVNALHRKTEILNLTPFQVFTEFLSLKHIRELDFNIPEIEKKGIDELNKMRKALSAYIGYLDIVGYNYKANCHYGYDNKDKSFEKEDKVKAIYGNLLKVLKEWENQDKINARLGLALAENQGQSLKLIEILNIIMQLKKINKNWLDKKIFKEAEQSLKKIREELSYYHKKTDELKKNFGISILDNDFEAVSNRFRTEYTGFFKIFNRNYKRDCALIKSYLTVKKRFSHEELQLIVHKIKKMQDTRKFLDDNRALFIDHLDYYYQGINTDVDLIAKQMKLTEKLNAACDYSLPEGLVDIICSSDCDKNNELISEIVSLKSSQEKLATLMKEVSLDFDSSLYDIGKENYADIDEKFTECLEKINKLNDWINFIEILYQVRENDLVDFIDKAIIEDLAPSEFEGVLKRRFYSLWIDIILRQNNSLARFSRERHESVIKCFREKDKLAFKISQARIREILSSERPGYCTASGNSEIGILLREAEKKRRQLSVRKLFEQIPNLIMTLKPCLLMSPMSVSQYINPYMIEFDVVIFDEASQIFPEDALGAIYRGKQLIVAGDSEQLPPTNFFNANASDNDFDTDEDDDGDDINAFESILDICNATLNRIKLKWHYRSRFEELIAFSNRHIYKNDLISFPSAKRKTRDLGVEYIFVPDGVYERSTSRINRPEAVKIAQMVFEHFDNNPYRTLGVVAFSEAQQEAIENQIAWMRKENLEYEKFFDESKDEPFFVKNIENVQGDERDTIIFSIGYARDKNGKMLMNFGPLSRAGGERRLNVAITRARYNVKLVGSIEASDINVEKSKKGVILLKNYIEFAGEGVEALHREEKKELFSERDFRLEKSVLKVLNDNGFSADTEIGCSGYKIDIAVVHPEHKDIYVLGIECDGHNYQNNRTARDRDRLKNEVLSRLDWKLYRIWAPDWIKRRDTEETKLIETVKQAIRNYSHVEALPLRTEAAVKDKLETVDTQEEVLFEDYNEVDFNECYRKGNSVGQNFKYIMNQIMENEAPVHINSVMKKITPLFGKIMSPAVQNQFKVYYRQWKPENVIYSKQYFMVKDKPVVMRKTREGGKARSIDMIHIDELYDGIKKIVRRDIGITRDGLVREMSNLIGYSRLTENISSVLNKSIDDLIRKKVIKTDGDMIRIY